MLSQELSNYLSQNQWNEAKCPSCSRLYWKKEYAEKETCQDNACQGGYNFHSLIKRKPAMTNLENLNQEFMKFFLKLGYEEIKPKHVLREKDTLFMICGLQAYDDILEGKTETPPNRYVFNQPSIRVEDLESISKTGRHSSSFNMWSTHQFNVNWNDYLRNLDEWFEFYTSRLKLPIQEMTIVEDFWEGGSMGGKCLEVYIGGAEISTHVFVEKPIQVVDIGVGLERIAWVTMKTPSIFEPIGPFDMAIEKRYVAMDSVRTSALLIGSGVMPGKKGAGNIVRNLISKNYNQVSSSDVSSLVNYYYNQWLNFTELKLEKEKVIETIHSELDREFNSQLLARIEKKKNLDTSKMRPNIDKKTGDFVRYLYENNIFFDDLKED